MEVVVRVPAAFKIDSQLAADVTHTEINNHKPSSFNSTSPQQTKITVQLFKINGRTAN